MVKALMRTSDDVAPMVARVVLGLVLLPHGLQKTVGMFGGYGFEGTMGFLTGLGIPTFFAGLAILVESLGALALILGLFGRVAALGVTGLMLTAAVLMHRGGFFVDWSGQQQGVGYEFHVLAIGLALVVLIKGSGKLSVDRAIAA
jgi:putative oxidoreductase